MAKARTSPLGTSSWKDQFKGAIILTAGKCTDSSPPPLLPINVQITAGESQFDSLEADYVPTCVDYICHFLSLFWKILFAFVPPTGNTQLLIVLLQRHLLQSISTICRYVWRLFNLRCFDICYRSHYRCYWWCSHLLWLRPEHQGLSYGHLLCRPRHQHTR